MKTEDNQVVKSNNNQVVGKTVDQTRRSISKAGILAPIAMTLANKTALGASYNCTPSGAQSGNASSHDTSPCPVRGVPLSQLVNIDQGSNPITYAQSWGDINPPVIPFRVELTNNGDYYYQRGSSDTNCGTPVPTGRAFDMCKAILPSPADTSTNSGICKTTGKVFYVSATLLQSRFPQFFLKGDKDDITVWDALNMGSFRAKACAAYLYALYTQEDFLTPQEVNDIWNAAHPDNPNPYQSNAQGLLNLIIPD